LKEEFMKNVITRPAIVGVSPDVADALRLAAYRWMTENPDESTAVPFLVAAVDAWSLVTGR
jgi:hypothetical protein